MNAHVDLQSLVDSHELPFVVIDRELRILALNRAYAKAYGVGSGAIGKPCFLVDHDVNRSCFEAGSDCPHRHVFTDLRPHSCLHARHDSQGRTHWVRVTAYPLRASDGEVWLGESFAEIGCEDDASAADPGERMVGDSPAFLTMIEQLHLAAGSRMPVLVLGETGTGKELAARFIHRHSDRREGPFQTVDCTTLNENLIESELFGHERGSFTGSVAGKRGLFDLADGGTLFLDEIGELPLAMQAKLLRALESGEFRRVGGQEIHHVDVRAVCATNRHLWEAVRTGRFREDLYHRIACVTVHLPPLRERLQDIPRLAEALLENLFRCHGRRYRLAPGAEDLLRRRTYSGNIRELRNILFGAASLAKGQLIEVEHIERMQRQVAGAGPGWENPREQERAATEPVQPAATNGRSGETRPTIANLEAEHIQQVLRQVKGRRSEAAQVLGISPRTLYRKIKLYRLLGEA